MLVHKYQFLEAIEVHSEMWLEKDKNSIPTTATPNVAQWLTIYWMLRRPDLFRKMTQISMRRGKGSLKDEVESLGDAPIPDVIIDDVESHRQAAIRRTFNLLEETLQKYRANDLKCTSCASSNGKICDAMLLESLPKATEACGIYPFPEAPYTGIRFADLRIKISRMKLASTCHVESGRDLARAGSGSLVHGGIRERKGGDQELDTLFDRLAGLHLANYVPQRLQ